MALIEKEDFCHATSANHLKMVHGGIRYLQHLDIPRVRDSLRERSALLRIAPHLVQPVPIVMPTYGHGMEGRFVLGSGFKLYDAIAADRNRGITDPARQIPRGRVLSRNDVLELFPDLDSKELTGAGLFYDGQFYNPQRLALAFLRAAIDSGAVGCNYMEAKGFLSNNGQVHGVCAHDAVSGDELEIRGRIFLNTAGPWAPGLLQTVLKSIPTPTFSRDAGLVLNRSITGEHALACRVKTSDPDALLSRHGRHVFLVPWRGHTLLGVWHKVHDGSPETFSVSEEEIQDWLDEVNVAYPAFELKRDDVSMVYSGLILFGENQPGSENLRFGKRSLVIDHGREDGLEGLWTLLGVRATTARGMAEKTISKILAKSGRQVRSKTREARLPGGDIDDYSAFQDDLYRKYGSKYRRDCLRSLGHNHGTEIDNVLRFVDEQPDLGKTVGDTTVLRAEVIHAVRSEMAVKLADVVLRRTELGTGGSPGKSALQECAELMARELHWDDARVNDELADVGNKFPEER